MKREYICGYCPRCEELKDDDYGQIVSRNGVPLLFDGNIRIVRGCRDCGWQLTSIKTLEKTMPDFLQSVMEDTEIG